MIRGKTKTVVFSLGGMLSRRSRWGYCLSCAAAKAWHTRSKLPGSSARPGFTLTELLVVVALMAVLAGLAAFFWPGFSESERSAQGASNLHNWLLTSRQRALLDQAPRGVRLYVGADGLIKQAQFIEQPDDFTGGKVSSMGNDPTKLLFENVDLYGGFGPGDPTLWPVQPGDYIQVFGASLMHQIRRDPNPQQWPVQDIVQLGPNSFQVQLISPLATLITTPTSAYRIIRKPRLQGEEPMLMPDGVGADLKVNKFYGKVPLPPEDGSGNLVAGEIDIVFSPNGNVMGNIGSSKLKFWIREYTEPSIFRGEPSLVVVYPQSGLVAGYPAILPDDLDLNPPPPITDHNPFGKVQ